MNLALCATTAGTLIGGVGLYLAQLPYVQDAIQAGEKAERMGIVGILTLLLIASVLGNVWLLRKGIFELLAILREVSSVVMKASQIMDRATTSVDVLKTATEDLRHVTNNCAASRTPHDLGRRGYDPHGEHHA